MRQPSIDKEYGKNNTLLKKLKKYNLTNNIIKKKSEASEKVKK